MTMTKPRGGARAGSGRKPLAGDAADTVRVCIRLDAATRLLLDAYADGSKGAYIREAMAALLASLVAGADVQPVPLQGDSANFGLKVPRTLLDAVELGAPPVMSSLSTFVRTAVARRAGKAGA